MSFRIDETTNMIRITRGDTGQFKIDLMNIDGSIYELKAEDLVQFTVKKSPSETAVLIQKTGLDIEIEPKDTSNLKYGIYYYDIQVTFADGRVNTVIDPAEFIITEEVTF